MSSLAFRRAIQTAAIVLVGAALALPDAAAFSSGLTGRTNKSGGAGCAGCHGGSPDATVSVLISGPTSLAPGQAGTYTVTSSKSGVANGTKVGLNIAASDSPTPLAVVTGMPTSLEGDGEIKHNSGVGALRATTSGAATHQFTYTMPSSATAGSTHTLYAVSAVSFFGWNHAANFTVTTQPVAPSTLAATNPTTTSVTLTWSGGGPNYRVVYKQGATAPANENDGSVLDLGAVTTTPVTGLNTGTQYTFKVYSKTASGTVFSANGATATATTASVSSSRFVNVATGANTGNCTNVASPCRTITYAMSQSGAGDTITVAPGLYSVASGEVFPISFVSEVKLLASAASPTDTVIDGTGDPVRKGLFRVEGGLGGFLNGTSRIEGFLLQNGRYEGDFGTVVGGAAIQFNNISSPFTVARNVFILNESRGFNATPGFGSGLTGSGMQGGAIAGYGAYVVIENNIFWGNTARGGNGFSNPSQPGPMGFVSSARGGTAEGGAIFIYGPGGGGATIRNNTFHQNSAVGGDAGTASDGQAQRGYGRGGALGGGSLSVLNNIFTNNFITSGAGVAESGVTNVGPAVDTTGLMTGFRNVLNGNRDNGTVDDTSPASLSESLFLTSGQTLYHGAPNSLLIRQSSPIKGQAISATEKDLLGTTRPAPPNGNGTPGAFEPYFIAQAITFGQPPTVAVGGTGTVSATGGGSGNTVTFTSTTPSVCTVFGSTVTGVSQGTCTVAANQSGNADFSAAPQVTQGFAIQAASTGSLTVVKAGAGQGTVSSDPAGLSCGSTCSANFTQGTQVTLTTVAAAGSVFAGWSGEGCTGTGSCVVSIQGSKGVTATFSPQQVELQVTRLGSGSGTVTSTPAGINCGSTCAAPFNLGATVTLQASASAGSVFGGWSGAGCVGTGTCNVTMSSAAAVTATFNPAPQSTSALTVSRQGAGRVISAPQGIDCGSACTFSYTTGTSVTLTASPDPGATFSGWSGGGCPASGTTCTVTMDLAKTVSATFTTPQFQLGVLKSGPGKVTSQPSGIDCGGACNAVFNAGTLVTLTAQGESGASLQAWGGACAGVSVSSTCQVTMSELRTVSANFVAAAATRLSNISTRGQVLTGTDVMIGGFVVGGSTPKRVLITARGPSLAAFGISNALANPKVELFQGQTKLMENDDWQTQSQAAGGSASVSAIQALGTFPNGLAPSNNNEAALMVTLAPGAYTAVVSGANNGTGVGIVEVFEQDGPSIPLSNISTRGRVGTGTDVMIGGFVVTGSTPQTLLITARGPSLTEFGIAAPLLNPKLEIFSGQTKLFENDDWQTQNAAAGGATAVTAIQALGTFPNGLAPSNANEAALLVTLPPGAYTAVVSGASNGTGVAIVEVFAR